jgi:hypothetical protein
MKSLNRALLILSALVAATQAVMGNLYAAYVVAFIGGAAAVPWSEHTPGLFCSLTIPENYMRAFSAIWGHTVQQETAKLANIVTIDEFEGKEKIYTDLNKVEFVKKRGRLQKTISQEASSEKRKMTRQDFSCHIIFDRGDNQLLGMLGEPTSEIQVEMRYAFQRSMDDGLIEAASGTVYGGADPYVTPITLPNAQKVAVNYVASGSPANSGLTPDKLQAAIKRFEDQDLDVNGEDFVLAIGPKQKEDLFQYVKTAPSSAYAMMIGKWLNNPNEKLFGFTVIVSTRLALNSGTDVRTCLAWSRRGIYAAPSEMEVMIDVLPEQEHARLISSYGQWGFMRRYEERVLEIYCDESP